MTSSEKEAAATARAAEARRVTAASLTEVELAALLKTRQGVATAAAAKVAAEAAAAKAAVDVAAEAAAARAAAPTGWARAAAGATADAGTTDAQTSEDRLVAKVTATAIATLKASGVFPTSQAKPAAEGGGSPLLAARCEEVAIIKHYKGAQAHEAPPPPTRACSRRRRGNWRPQTKRRWRPPGSSAHPSSS